MKHITLSGVLILCCFCSVHAAPKRSSATNESNMHELQKIQPTPAKIPPRRLSNQEIIKRANQRVLLNTPEA